MAVNAGPEGRLLVTTDTTWPLRFSGRQRLVLFVLLGAGVHAVGGRRVGGRALHRALWQPRGAGRRRIGAGPGGPPAGVPRLRPRGEPHTPAAAAGRRLASGGAARGGGAGAPPRRFSLAGARGGTPPRQPQPPVAGWRRGRLREPALQVAEHKRYGGAPDRGRELTDSNEEGKPHRKR